MAFEWSDFPNYEYRWGDGREWRKLEILDSEATNAAEWWNLWQEHRYSGEPEHNVFLRWTDV